MKNILLILLILLFSNNILFAITDFEKLRREKTAAYKKALQDVDNWVSKSCPTRVGHAHDALLGPCSEPIPAECKCHCQAAKDANAKKEQIQKAYEKAMGDISHQEELERKKQVLINNQKSVVEEDQQKENNVLQNLRNEFEQTQIRMQNEQQEIENAGNSALLSVQNSIAKGKKTSGALIGGAIAGASEISDLDSRRTYLGVMGAAALLSFFGEKRQEKLEKEQQVKREKQQIEREQKRLQDIANMQANYYLNIPIGQSLSKASLYSSDTVWGYFIAYPKNFIPGEGFEILMSNPFKIGKYNDDTWPLLTDLTKKIDKKLIADKVGTNWVIKVRCFFKNEIETYTDMLTIQSDTYKIDGKVIAIDFTLNNVDQNNLKKAKSFWDEN